MLEDAETSHSGALWIDAELLPEEAETTPEAAVVTHFLRSIEGAAELSTAPILNADVGVLRVLEAVQESLWSDGRPVRPGECSTEDPLA